MLRYTLELDGLVHSEEEKEEVHKHCGKPDSKSKMSEHVLNSGGKHTKRKRTIGVRTAKSRTQVQIGLLRLPRQTKSNTVSEEKELTM